MIHGDDFIGGSNYRKLIKEVLEEGRAIGILISADGWKSKKAWRVVKNAAKQGKCPIIKIASRWEDGHLFNEKHIRRARKHLEKTVELANEYPEQEFWFNPWLEYRASEDDVRKLNKKLKKILKESGVKNITLVYNPENLGYYYPKGKTSILELHHIHFKAVKGKRQSFSWDGKDSVDGDVEKTLKELKKADVEACFFWDWRYNGKYSEKDKRKRADRTDWPDKKFIKSIRALSMDKGKTKFDGNNRKRLFKTHAENHGDDPHKAEKLVVQIDENDPLAGSGKITLKQGEKTFKSLDGYYSDRNKAWIYRFNDWGIDIMKELDKPVVEIYKNQTYMGDVNPCFREGYYRY